MRLSVESGSDAVLEAGQGDLSALKYIQRQGDSRAIKQRPRLKDVNVYPFSGWCISINGAANKFFC